MIRIETGTAVVLLASLAALAWAPGAATAQQTSSYGAGSDVEGETAIVIHGGAGSIREVDMTEEEERAYRSKMQEALEAGTAVLGRGGSSVDACVAAIRVMEASPLFNAGVGAVFTSQGTVEHDASIMDGRSLSSGAVTGVKHLPSPIRAARLVMDSSRHVFLAQEGAETFAFRHGMDSVANETFYTEARRRAWERSREEGGGDGADPGGPRAEVPAPDAPTDAPGRAVAEGESVAGAVGAGVRGDRGTVRGGDDSEVPGGPRGGAVGHLGTVGCAALDRQGDLAAGTSTGGIGNKRFGRIGDSPVVGAGTYADNQTAAVSATGHGEDFIRLAVAHDIVSMMRYAGLSLTAAANAVIHGRLEELGPQARGGVIALDREGNIAAPFNTPGMFRGWVDTEGETVIDFYRN